MGWITSSDKTYWMPDNIPANTEEYNSSQASKIYLKQNSEETGHPGWFYGNGSLVCDEYLFHNEGWKKIIENKPEQVKGYKVVFDSWNEIDEKTIEKKYTLQILTEEEIVEIENNLWNYIRDRRNTLLSKTDYHSMIAFEEGMTLSEEFKTYRKKLRDLPETIDIKTFNMDTYVWPSLPNTIYVS